MPTAAQTTGDIAILDTVAAGASDDAIREAFGFGRPALLAIIAGADLARKQSLIKKAWNALFLDPGLVSIPGTLLRTHTRAHVAASLANTAVTSQFYSGAHAATALHHRIIANTLVTRATFFQFEKDTVNGVDRLLRGAMKELLAETETVANLTLARLMNETDPVRRAALQRKLVFEIKAGRGGSARGIRAMEEAMREYEQSYRAYLMSRGASINRIAHQRAVDTLYHFEHKANWWSRLRHPLSAAEMGAELYSGRVQDLAVARIRTLIEKRGLPFSVRRSISDIIAKEVFVKGEAPRVAAAKILAKFRAELGERWGGAKVSAERIARTETAAIMAQGTLLAYEQMGVEWVNVHWTEGRYPCDICPPIADGGPYPVRAIPGGGIPFHPRCRCSYSVAEPPRGKGKFKTTHPAIAFGKKAWASILAKFGFIAATAAAAFGRSKASDSDLKAREQALGKIDIQRILMAPTIIRPGPMPVEITGFRRIESGALPLPVKGHFVRVKHRDPVRAVLELRRNNYEVGGVIRGKDLHYYKGEGGSVSIVPIHDAVGGFIEGDILFHTHPGSLPDGLSDSLPSEADIRVHLLLSTQLGNGARHIIGGSDGLRELRVVITNEDEWKTNIQSRLFSITMLFFEEMMRGSEWYATYGIRRALRRLKDANLGGHLIVSEAANPGSAFVPLAEYNPTAAVPAVVVKTLESLTTQQMRVIYDAVSADQGAPSHRERDYYVGVLRGIDPARDWNEAAPTKARAIELLNDQGAGVTGTRWTRDELLAHLTGQPVWGRVYLDLARVDFRRILDLTNTPLAPAVDRDYLGDIMDFIDDEFLDLIYDRISVTHGIPAKTDTSVMIAMLEFHDPDGSHHGASREVLGSRMATLNIAPEWTNEEKRSILSGEAIFGLTFITDLTLVQWGAYFHGMPETPPDITPLPVPTPSDGAPTLTVLHQSRGLHFREMFGINLVEGTTTAVWTLEELRLIEYLLITLPEARNGIDSIIRHAGMTTHYDTTLRRLVVGKLASPEKLAMEVVQAMVDAIIVGHLRAAHAALDSGGDLDLVGPVSRSPIMRQWIRLDQGGWRYRDADGAHDPVSTVGTNHVLAAKGHWIDLAHRGEMVDKEWIPAFPSPWWTLIHSILDYLWEPERLTQKVYDWMRDNVFSGGTFTVDPAQIAASEMMLPVRQ